MLWQNPLLFYPYTITVNHDTGSSSLFVQRFGVSVDERVGECIVLYVYIDTNKTEFKRPTKVFFP